MKNISVTTNTLCQELVKKGENKQKQGARKKPQRGRTGRNQNKYLFYILDGKFLNVDTALHQILYLRNRANTYYQLLHLPEAFVQAAIP